MSEETKQTIQEELEVIRSQIIEVENWQSILQHESSKKILQSLDDQINDIREQYGVLNAKKEDFAINFSLLQGAEMQMVKYKNWLLSMDEVKKNLVNRRENLILLEQDEEGGSTSRGGILSQSLKKENYNA